VILSAKSDPDFSNVNAITILKKKPIKINRYPGFIKIQILFSLKKSGMPGKKQKMNYR